MPYISMVLASCNLFQTEVGSESSDRNRKGRMFKLMAKEIIPDEVQWSILATEETDMEAYKPFGGVITVMAASSRAKLVGQ